MIFLLMILATVSCTSSQYNFRVSENRSPNTFVGQILVKSELKYDFYEKKNMFAFDPTNGMISTRIKIDRESLETELVSIFISERQGSVFIRTINVNVRIIDENDNPPVFSPNNVKRTVVENTVLLTEIGLPTATDNDSAEFGLRNNYQIESGNEDGRFRLTGVDEEGGQLSLQVARPLDREVKAIYNLTITVQDKGQPPLSGRLFVELFVDDYNDNGPVFSPSKYTVLINETSPIGSIIVTLHATDADLGENSRVSYRFKKTKSSREGEFLLDDKSGLITLVGTVTCHKTQERCLLIVEAFDHGAPSLSAFCYVTVTVLRVNLHAPRITVSYVSSLSNTAFIEVDKITKRPLVIIHAVDDDQNDETDQILITLVKTKLSSIFMIHKTHGNFYLLKQISKTTSAHPQSFTVTIRAIDSGSPRKESQATVNIFVNDRNIHKPLFPQTFQRVFILKNLPESSFIIRVQAVDKDAGLNGKVTYSVQDNYLSNTFRISKTSGLVTLQHSLLFSDEAHYNLTITGKDSGISPLQSSMIVDVVVLPSQELRARFRKKYSEMFIVNAETKGEKGLYFVYNLRNDIQVSDSQRWKEVTMLVLDENVRSVEYSVYVTNICSTEEVQNVTLILTTSDVVLDKIFLLISLSPFLISRVCWSKPLTFIRRLPDVFSYNHVLINLVESVPLYGIFLQVSRFDNIFLSDDGKLFWREPMTSMRVSHEIKIIFRFTFKKVSLSRNISVVLHKYGRIDTILNCTKFQTLVTSSNIKVDPKSFLEIDGKEESIILVDAEEWVTDPGMCPSDNSCLRRGVSLTAYNLRGYQTCFSNFNQSDFRFLKRQFYFRSEETKSGSRIGELKSEGNLNPQTFTIKLSGQNSSLIKISNSDWAVDLINSVAADNKIRIFNTLVLVLDATGNKELDKIDIFIELVSMYVSAEFTRSAYVFVVPEDAMTHTPLVGIGLIETQNYADFEFVLPSNHTYPQWGIFPDGRLYTTSGLDYEEVREYNFEVMAVNRFDKQRKVGCQVRIVVEDVNDNAPMFIHRLYYFVVSISHCGINSLGRVAAVDEDSGMNGDIEYTLSGTIMGMDMLHVDLNSGVITMSGCAPWMIGRFQFTVVATDRGDPQRSSKADVHVRITKRIRVKMRIVSNNVIKISEDTVVGSVIEKVEAINCPRIKYKITRTNANGEFFLNDTTGELILQDSLDRERMSKYRLLVSAICVSDLGSASAMIHISVLDTNDHWPVFDSRSPREVFVSESTKVGTILATYSAFDRDEGANGAVKYRLTAAGVGETTIFKVDTHSGILYLNRGIDYEYRSRWIINITAFDQGLSSLSTRMEVTINVANVNDHKPIFVDEREIHLTIPEDLPPGSVVGKVVALDSDNSGVVYVFQSIRPSDHPFDIDRLTGVISLVVGGVKERLYSATVLAIDSRMNQWLTRQIVFITISGSADSGIEMMSFSATMLPSTLFIGDKMATIKARFKDQSREGNLVYKISHATMTHLSINSYTGDLYLQSGMSANFTYLEVTLIISQQAHSAKKTELIHTTKLIRNIDNSYDLNFQRNEYMVEISEAKLVRGAKLLRVHALYPGNPIAQLEYLISDVYMGISSRIRLPSSTVSLDPVSGWLMVGSGDIDREDIEGSQITVEIIVLDVGRNRSRMSSTKAFINILDINDNKPRFTNETYVFHVPEKVSKDHRLLIGRVMAVDRDLDSVLLYNWTSGNQSYLHLDMFTGEITTTDASLDYATMPYIWLTARVSDGLFTSTTEVLIIVDDVNDHGPVFPNHTFHFQCMENVPLYTIIGQVRALDLDSEENARTRYSLISEWGSDMFLIHPDHGIISTQGDIDYERSSHYVLLVTATDISPGPLISPAEATATATVLVSIVNDNDNAPIFLKSFLNISMQEDALIGSVLATLEASDQDVDDTLQFEILSSNDDIFSVDHLSGIITLIGPLNYEETKTHHLTVTCTDGSLTATAMIQVNIVNVNDNPPIIHNPTTMILSHDLNDHPHFIHCTDVDNLADLRYRIKEQSPAQRYVRIDTQSGQITPLFRGTFTKVLEFFCSDGYHETMKNITVYLTGNTSTTITTSLVLTQTASNDKPILTKEVLQAAISFPLKDYKFFIKHWRNDKSISDWIYFTANQSNGEILTVKAFDINKSTYRFAVIGVPLLLAGPYTHTDVTVMYGNVSHCDPRFVGTPYSYRIMSPITKTRVLGTVSVKYCMNRAIEYFLSSGHSFFTVNASSGEIFVHQTPPQGFYQYKLTAVVYATSKMYLSTVFGLETSYSEDDKTQCQYNTLRLFANASDPLGTVLGRVRLKSLAPDSTMVRYRLTHCFLFSVSTHGDVIVRGNLSTRGGMKAYFNVSVSWSTRSESREVQCKAVVEIIHRRKGCALSLTYPGDRIYLRVPHHLPQGSFIFSLPVSLAGCAHGVYDNTFQLSNPYFYIASSTGSITSKVVLSEGTYPLSVTISSPITKDSLVVHLVIDVVPHVANTEISFSQSDYNYTIQSHLTSGSTIGSIRSILKSRQFTSELIRYSLVSLCCFYGDHIAVYNGSIYESPFHLDEVSGVLTFKQGLSNLPTMSYSLIIRSFVSTTSPPRYNSKDVRVYIRVEGPSYTCRHRFFRGVISEGVTGKIDGTEDVLILNREVLTTIRLQPEMVRKYLLYDMASNTLHTTDNPMDYERIHELEVSIIIGGSGGGTVQCPGIITVQDTNDNAPRFLRNYFIGYLEENAPINTWVVDVEVRDTDSSKYPLTYILYGAGSDNFRIDRGRVYSTRVLDREERDRYDLKVRVSDGVHAMETGMLITILDVNDNAPQVTIQAPNATVVINRSRLKSGDLLVTHLIVYDRDDPLSNNSKVTCTLTSHVNTAVSRTIFAIDPTTCTLNINQKYIDLIPSNYTFKVNITVYDRGTPPISNHSIVRIYFVAEAHELQICNKTYKPLVSLLYASPKNTTILNLAVLDRDKFENVVFDLSHGNGTSSLAVDPTTGMVSTMTAFKQSSIGLWYTIHVRVCAHPRGGAITQCSNTVPINVVISDFNLYSPEIRIDPNSLTVSEDIEVRRVLTKIRFVDKDEGISGMVQISLDPPSLLFSLEASTERNTFDLVTITNLDYESQVRHDVIVIATDLGSPSRSQTSKFTLTVTDVDDNAPYFPIDFIIIRLPSPQSIFELPLARDDDASLKCKKNSYSASPADIINLRFSHDRITANINRRYYTSTLLRFTLMVSSEESKAKCDVCGRLNVYIIIDQAISSELDCHSSMGGKAVKLRSRHYHILSVFPRSSSPLVDIDPITGEIVQSSRAKFNEVIYTVSQCKYNEVKYKICRSKGGISDVSNKGSYTIHPQEIVITNTQGKGAVVGKVSVVHQSGAVSRSFYFQLFAPSFIPFNFLHGGDTIIASMDIVISGIMSYNITVVARHRNMSDIWPPLIHRMRIVVGMTTTPKETTSHILRVREGIGNGLVVGKIDQYLTPAQMNNFVVEDNASGSVMVDKKGSISVIRGLDRTLATRYNIGLFSSGCRIKIMMMIVDENDRASVARITKVVINVLGDTVSLGRVTQLIPVDNDTVGNYHCRLNSLDLPQGVILTTDCWLYVTDPSSIVNTSQSILVLHHDGLHYAVKSLFHLTLRGALITNEATAWCLIRLKLFKINLILPRLKLLNEFLWGKNLRGISIGVNAVEGYVIIQGNVMEGRKVSWTVSGHKSAIERILGVEGVEIVSDVCTVDSCDFHGVCTSVLRADKGVMFTDDDQRERGEIHVYPMITAKRTCVCHRGYVGATCNVSTTCPHQICHNGGTCGQDSQGHPACVCGHGYTGARCDQDVNECLQSSRCATHGKCVNTLGGYKCECSLDWSGSPLCQMPFNHCQSRPCSSQGTIQCIPVVGGFICRCSFGYYGDRCAISSFSLRAQSSIYYELTLVETISLEFATISATAPLLNVRLSPSIKANINIVMGNIHLVLLSHNRKIDQKRSNIDVSSGTWIKLILRITSERLSLEVVVCGTLNECERTNTIYGGEIIVKETIVLTSTHLLLTTGVTVALGNDESHRSRGKGFFVGCIRSIDIHNGSLTSKREVNVLYDSCKRYNANVAPCGYSADKCGAVGNCVDEWFDGRCTCPAGYEPPGCTPGHSAVSLSHNTIIAFVQRPQYQVQARRRHRREVAEETSEISLKIKTKDVNSILLLSFSSLHTFTLIQVSNGIVKVVDKFAGTTQHLSHQALVVNDDRIHAVTLTRYSSGKVTVTVDSVVAIVEWLQSHDPLGPSVQTIYVAGVPQADRTEELMDIPNYFGCLAEIRFNNVSQPLSGLTERFNVSLVQGSIAGACSSDVCADINVCGKYQVCREVLGEPHSYWGQYQCLNDERSRLLAILTPVLVCITLCVVLIILFMCMRMRRRDRRRKGKSPHIGPDFRSNISKKNKHCSQSKHQNLDILNAQSNSRPPRSVTSSTLLMKDQTLKSWCHPDIIPKFGSLSRSSEPSYYQDTPLVNPYMSSDQFDARIASSNLPAKMTYLMGNKPGFYPPSHPALTGVDDSLEYRCIHQEDYDVINSQTSSNRQRFSSDQGQGHSITPDYNDHILPIKPGISSASGTRPFTSLQVDVITQPPSWSHQNTPLDKFSTNDGSFTTSMQARDSNESLSTRSSHHNCFTSTDSSDSMASNKNRNIPKASSCWVNLQRVLPPPPQTSRPSEELYEYDDVRNSDPIS